MAVVLGNIETPSARRFRRIIEAKDRATT
jgi:hypothetical protein